MKSVTDRDGKEWTVSGSSKKTIVDPQTLEPIGKRRGNKLIGEDGTELGRISQSKLDRLLGSK